MKSNIQLTLLLPLIFLTHLSVAQITTSQLSLTDSTRDIIYPFQENEIRIHNLPTNAKVKFSSGKVEQSGNVYTVRIAERNKGYDTLTISKSGKTIFSKIFEVHHFCDPQVALGAIRSTYVTVNQLLGNTKLLLHYTPCLYKKNIIAQVVSFEITFVSVAGGEDPGGTIHGNSLTPDHLEIIRHLKSGDKIFIENIKAKGPDGTTRSLGLLKYIIK
jgi:hypothetical protein